jgi:tRNA(fMet)-specific endonuclease VapC
MSPSLRYLLDTNILVHSVRQGVVWNRIREEYQLLLIEPTPLISVVVAGELRSLAHQWGWGEAKRGRMEFALGYFHVVTIHDPPVIEAYAAIDAHFQRQGRSVGKNDLWIAATTMVSGATLLTTDHDFDDMDPLFLTREWVNPITRD